MPGNPGCRARRPSGRPRRSSPRPTSRSPDQDRVPPARRAGQPPGAVFSPPRDLLEKVWGHGVFGDGRLVGVHVRQLRTKIEADPADPATSVTVRARLPSSSRDRRRVGSGRRPAPAWHPPCLRARIAHLGARSSPRWRPVAVSITTLTVTRRTPDRPAQESVSRRVLANARTVEGSVGRAPTQDVRSVLSSLPDAGKPSVILPGDGRTVVASLDTPLRGRLHPRALRDQVATGDSGILRVVVDGQPVVAIGVPLQPDRRLLLRGVPPRRHRRRVADLGFTLVLATRAVDGGRGCRSATGQPVHAAAADPHRRGDRGCRPGQLDTRLDYDEYVHESGLAPGELQLDGGEPAGAHRPRRPIRQRRQPRAPLAVDHDQRRHPGAVEQPGPDARALPAGPRSCWAGLSARFTQLVEDLLGSRASTPGGPPRARQGRHRPVGAPPCPTSPTGPVGCNPTPASTASSSRATSGGGAILANYLDNAEKCADGRPGCSSTATTPVPTRSPMGSTPTADRADRGRDRRCSRVRTGPDLRPVQPRRPGREPGIGPQGGTGSGPGGRARPPPRGSQVWVEDRDDGGQEAGSWSSSATSRRPGRGGPVGGHAGGRRVPSPSPGSPGHRLGAHSPIPAEGRVVNGSPGRRRRRIVARSLAAVAVPLRQVTAGARSAPDDTPRALAVSTTTTSRSGLADQRWRQRPALVRARRLVGAGVGIAARPPALHGHGIAVSTRSRHRVGGPGPSPPRSPSTPGRAPGPARTGPDRRPVRRFDNLVRPAVSRRSRRSS